MALGQAALGQAALGQAALGQAALRQTALRQENRNSLQAVPQEKRARYETVLFPQ